MNTTSMQHRSIQHGLNATPAVAACDHDHFVPWDIEVADYNFGANCGPVSFAAAFGREVCRSMRFFRHFEERHFTNLTQMKSAFALAGATVEVLKCRWPAHGVALIQWLGPWTEKQFFARWTLPHTHWVAVDGDWIFDHSERRWMPKQEWDETVAPLYLEEIPRATGWAVKYGVQPNICIWSGSDQTVGSSTGSGSLSFSGYREKLAVKR